MADKTRHKIKNLLMKLNDEDRNTLCCLLIKAGLQLGLVRNGWVEKDRQCISWNFGRRLQMIKKRKARKPLARKITYLKFGFVITEHENHYCPRCNHVLNAGPNYQPKYCDQCGQKISFSGIRWKEDVQLGYAKRGEAYESV